MIRRTMLQLLATVGIVSQCEIGFAEEPPGALTITPGITSADLEQTLKSGLKARRPVEFEFIQRVVTMVKNDELPIGLVQSTFLWARRHQPKPYPYFERGLRERANKIGISITQGLVAE